ncbi:MAG: DUF305 domain-containing protein [Pelagibaca sp.]
MMFPVRAALVALCLTPALAMAQSGHIDHSAHTMPAHATLPASTQAYIAVNDAMHRDMAITFTGDADVDFLLGMIPHHEGAVAMARVVMEYGADAETRKLAEEIIASQEAEIAWMKARLSALGQY